MQKQTFHDESQFNNLDWNTLIPSQYKTNGINYSFGQGGNNYKYGKGWFLTIFDSDFNEEIWQLPTAISNFIEWTDENARKEKLSEIQRVLGVK